MYSRMLSFLFVAFSLLTIARQSSAQPSDTEFLFTGRLVLSGVPQTGTFDFRFTLFNALTAGQQIGSQIIVSNVPVSNGDFSLTLDFGSDTLSDAPRFFQPAQRKSGTASFANITGGRVLLTSRFSLAAGAALGLDANGAEIPCNGDFQINSNTNVSTAVGSGAFKILNSAGTAGLQFDTNDILCLGSSIFSLNGSNSCDTRINSTVFITTGQHVGIGDTVPDFRLELPNIASTEGRGRANAWVTYSSGRWKENVQPIDHALEKVLGLRGVMFDWKPEFGGGRDIGFVGEEAGKVVPELVTWEGDTKNASGMKYDRVTALLVEAVKSLKKSNDQKETELQEMKREIQTLKAMIQRPAARHR